MRVPPTLNPCHPIVKTSLLYVLGYVGATHLTGRLRVPPFAVVHETSCPMMKPLAVGVGYRTGHSMRLVITHQRL